MTKIVKLIYGLNYHAEGILFERGKEVPVSDEVAEILKGHVESQVEYIGSTYVKTDHPRFAFSERELTDGEKLAEVLDETEGSDAAKPRGRPKTVKETVAEMSEEDKNK